MTLQQQQEEREQSEEAEISLAIARSLGQEVASAAPSSPAAAAGGGGGGGGVGSQNGGGAGGPSMALLEEVLPSMAFDDARGFLVDGANDGEGGPECSICLCELQPEAKVRLLPCVHVYHVDCIDHWFRRAAACPACPTCKAPVAIG